jgi:asparagine synthase (glutamine-hydrolysing)
MCGFAGFFSNRTLLRDDFKDVLTKVGQTIQHRGPDDSGVWLDKSVGIGLVHRRLSIQDISPLGAQPMVSSSGRYIMVFNGEIYNFKTLRAELEKKGFVFRGHSDTETILASFEAHGIEKSLKLFSGMFAIAVYDRETKQLTLVRDRLGEKPLYYGWVNGYLVFASELKALQAFPFWEGEINRDALTLLLRHNYILAPHSIYKEIYKLPPATSVCIKLSSEQVGHLPEPLHYWSLSRYFGQVKNTSITSEDATNQLDELLREVISEQMISDVPLGAFLSGGVDSSAIVAIMQQISSSPVRSFSIGFNEKKFNEAEYAKAVAKHLGTEHTELYVTAKDGLNIIPRLPALYDEPFADSSQIPTYLVAEMTKRDVTVALSGDGGDELFCGYSRYFKTAAAWSNNNSKNAGLANKLVAMAIQYSPGILSKLIKLFIPSQGHLSVNEIAEKISRRQLLLSMNEFNEFYRQTISYWTKPEHLVLGAKEPLYSMREMPPVEIGSGLHKQMMWQDLNCYLPDDILVKVDRAAMACSLETRIPLLDRRIVEFALGLPIDLNISGKQGKQVLRDVLYRYVPRQLIEREKAGFAVPVGQWLRGELKEWAESLLEPSKLSAEGFWNVNLVRRKWDDHIAGRGDHEFHLWGVLMFQAWYEQQNNV